MKSHHHAMNVRTTAMLLLLLAGTSGCEGDDGATGPAGPAGPGSLPAASKNLDKDEAAPGIVVDITEISGATGSTGNFAPGDTISFTFTLRRTDGSEWGLDEFEFTRALVSGPSFNYQRVLAEVNDVGSMAVQNSDGSWTYTFASPIPSTYLAPLNDTASFDADDGELTGMALLDGTYTLGIYFGWNYTVDGASRRDSMDDTFDFLIGTSVSTVESREVVGQENCNACHGELQFHGGLRRATTLCLLCHTAGSEDRNTMGVAGGTPGVTVDFDVMIHRIHNAAHLPSVLGVTTDMMGDRDYTATPQPLQYIGFGNNVADLSDIVFPAWPNLEEPMPRDQGYSSLSGVEQDLEDEMRSGATSCYLCHGDPDGAGPIEAPAQGDLAYSQPSRAACASCHDDWIPELPYVANGQLMPAQLSDGACTVCHPMDGVPLAVMEAHLHPQRDPTFAEGFNIDVTALAEAGTNDGSGTLDPGEKVAVTFTIQDDMGTDIAPGVLNSVDFAISGPTSNLNMVHLGEFPIAALTGAQPFTVNVPERVYLEAVGDDAGGLQMFSTTRTPHWNVSGATTDVLLRTGTGASTTLAVAVDAPTNFIDVASAAGFARDDYVVIDDGGGGEEYLQIQFVDGNRIWFSSPQTDSYPTGPLADHSIGTSVDVVTTSSVAEGVDYSLNAMTGTLTELLDFGNTDAVLVSYTTDFVMPSVYPVTLNGGPDLTEVQGGWTGKSLVDGTYTFTMWGRRDLSLALFGETNSYRELAPGETFDFLVGGATMMDPYDEITSAATCNACHVDLVFHGRNRRGFAACLACHGAAATGDRPRYVAANAPETPGVTIDFAEMIHKIHAGSSLANASSYVVVGFGPVYPNNFGSVTFEEIHFPSQPDGVKDCAACHGSSTAFRAPSDLDHPTEQVTPARGWQLTCGSCHDSTAEAAHIDAQTSPGGVESCELCHGPSEEWSVEVMHQVR